jgi:diguanylate cyclase
MSKGGGMSQTDLDEFEISLAIGEKAFSSLTINAVPVWPDLYEVLYCYESGENVGIVQAVNQLKKKCDFLDAGELQKIHDEHLSSVRLEDVSENISSRINEEIRKIIEAMNQAGEQSDRFDKALGKMESRFSTIKTADQLAGAVGILSEIARAIADNNRNLNDQLGRSQEQIHVLHKELESARNESNTDALTGLANRKKFDISLRMALRQFHESGDKLCLLMLDIDHFKNFNDSFGHQTGDQILRLVAHTLRHGLKGRDLAARYGGEEFGIIMAATSKENAYKVAEQIRSDIAAKELIKRSSGENLGRLTISVGIAEAQRGESPRELIERADKALYQAKNTGRNRCIIAPDKAEQDKLEELPGLGS